MLCGESIYLRLVEEGDLPSLMAWRNRPDVWGHFYNKFPLSLWGQRKWFEQIQQSYEKKFFIICLCEDDRPIGTIALNNLDFANQSLEVGNVLVGDSDSQGKGLGKEALTILLDFCFSELNMNRVFLHVFRENASAVCVYEKCGFSIEGILRESHFSGGEFKDTLVMSLLRKEYKKAIEKAAAEGP